MSGAERRSMRLRQVDARPGLVGPWRIEGGIGKEPEARQRQQRRWASDQPDLD
jgi:hypothetical protein